MTDPVEQPRTPAKWHESAGTVLVVLIFGAVVTSPCWGFVLLVAVAR